MSHVSGKHMIADLLTKAVSRPIYLKLLGLLSEYAAKSTVKLPAASMSDATGSP